MHNKFFVIDARDGAGRTPVVIAGSWNATVAQTQDDPNNLVLIRDSAVAGAYLAEFEEMWGSRTDTPSVERARFGPAKADNTDHVFTLSDGIRVDVYFSPTDGTESRIRSALATGQTSILTANFTLTSRALAQQMNLQKTRFDADVRSIVDNVADSGSQFTFLQSFADAHDWQHDPLFHHKYAVIDAVPIGGGSFPQVVTGSHNWTYGANAINDENTLIIHSAAIANLYLQEFAARYREVGGTRSFVSPTGVIISSSAETQIRPVPFQDVLVIPGLASGDRIVLLDIFGRAVYTSTLAAPAEELRLALPAGAPGLYLLRIETQGSARTLVVPRR
jgi:phosphatidylserine/phosphatidylglycerophosphate/cardiolipin synthase-like enzyme